MSLRELYQQTHEYFTFGFAVSAFVVSIASFVLSLRTDGRAIRALRPYISTGVHVAHDDMGLSLSNYGVGLAIITAISFRKGAFRGNSAVPLLSGSPNYDVNGIYFVQDRYYLRPGDKIVIASAEAAKGKANAALADWSGALEGLEIDVRYLDIIDKAYNYHRIVSAARVAAPHGSNT